MPELCFFYVQPWTVSASSFPWISQWDGIHWSAIFFVCESSETAFCSVLLVLCFAGDMMVSSTDLQSFRKTRYVFSSVVGETCFLFSLYLEL